MSQDKNTNANRAIAQRGTITIDIMDLHELLDRNFELGRAYMRDELESAGVKTRPDSELELLHNGHAQLEIAVEILSPAFDKLWDDYNLAQKQEFAARVNRKSTMAHELKLRQMRNRIDYMNRFFDAFEV